MLNHIVLMSQKGGSGKTTLAIHLAVASMQSGERTLLLDTDPQGSALSWAKVRQGQDPKCLAVRPWDLERYLDSDSFTLAITDTAPHAAPEASRIARLADIVLVPVKPSALDLSALPATLDILKASKTPALFVLSSCPARAKEVEEVIEILKNHNLDVASTVIHERRPYVRALAGGVAVTEFDARGKAAGEILALWKEVQSRISS